MKKLIIIFIASLGLLSCNKDVLDTPPLDKVSDAFVWSDLKLVEAYINEKYAVLPHFYLFSGVPSHGGYSAASDECFAKFDYESVNRITTGAMTPDNMALDSWGSTYSFVRDLNLFFQRIEEVPGEEDLKTRLTGEATFIRAYCYFDLVSKYGGIPLITKAYNATDGDFSAERASYDEILEFVVSELDKAVALLPESYPDNQHGRATKGAALALKSRMLLYAASELWNPNNDPQKWQRAADAAKAVIDLNLYSLYQGENYHDLFLDAMNSEAIMVGRQNEVNYNLRQDVLLAPNGYHGWSSYTPTQHIVDQFEMKNGKMINDPTSGYDLQNPYVDRDPRFYANILHNGAPFRERDVEYFQGGKDSPQSPIENWNASLTGYNWRKYLDETYDFNTQAVGSKTPFMMFRLSEIYLNYAETMNMLGNDAEAQKYLNLIRSRTGVEMPAVAETGTALRDKIRHEREVELCLEGNRFFDVRRWKIADISDNKPAMGIRITKNSDGSFTYDYDYQVQARKFIAPQHYLFPIPKSELDKVTLPQNPGY